MFYLKSQVVMTHPISTCKGKTKPWLITLNNIPWESQQKNYKNKSPPLAPGLLMYGNRRFVQNKKKEPAGAGKRYKWWAEIGCLYGVVTVYIILNGKGMVQLKWLRGNQLLSKERIVLASYHLKPGRLQPKSFDSGLFLIRISVT